MSVFYYVDFDYKDGRLGVRFEPKNDEVVQALTSMIPPEMRQYHADKRRWILDPRVGPGIVEIIRTHVPDAPVRIEEKNEELIVSLLFGPEAFNNRKKVDSLEELYPDQTFQLRIDGPNIAELFLLAKDKKTKTRR